MVEEVFSTPTAIMWADECEDASRWETNYAEKFFSAGKQTEEEKFKSHMALDW
jgi:hypothetical protein